ncbi:hypothetical protein ROHU_026659 [Labeo rohita]|uniref:Uncharacterized protein n=1 Tax=Labeo rohita TaxID=84645 RepID=A0A498MEJ8_LABRO|nr:hypothetical protein ROHU_026659 [Labeo rohita]
METLPSVTERNSTEYIKTDQTNSKSVLVMNSMFLAWTLSFLILSYTLGFPMLNNTSSGSQTETFLNVTTGNFTASRETSPPGLSEGKSVLVMNSMFVVWTLSFLILSYTLGFPNPKNIRHALQLENNLIKVMRVVCPLATCSLSNLGSSLQIGDEVAGDSARDPMGNGKK